MSAEKNENVDKSSKIKKAAELLVRGGSLIGQPCNKCGGVPFRFKDVITCINCGIKENTSVLSSNTPQEESRTVHNNLESGQMSLEELTEQIVRSKIMSLILEIKNENDIPIQKQKAELIEIYLVILEKTKRLANRFNFY
jgi:uncharacterized Zn finger protein (UPF0148 family)